MWRACRVAALRQLSSQGSRLPVAGVQSLALQSLRATPTALPSFASAGFTNIAGVSHEMLMTLPARDLQEQLGGAEIGRVAKALVGELDAALKREDVTSDEIIDLFTAAQKTRAVKVMLKAYEFLDAKYPDHINFAVYGEIFRLLLRHGDFDRMVSVYEKAKPRYQVVPEIIFRFGVVGYLQKHDLANAIAIWEEMKAAGHETTNEIVSRLMMAYAHEGHTDKVEELYATVDPQIGQWHETSIDRVVVSMGIIGQPEKSFEFYSNSSMKLSGGTLIALLSVCYNNGCKQQASDILANRTKFDLHLNARAYNRIMITLEFLDRHDEILDVLEEMRANNVRFDTKTREIMERNAELLKDTNYITSVQKIHDSKVAGYTTSPRIRELLKKGEISEAAAFVDGLLKPLNEEDVEEGMQLPEGAMIVSPSVSMDAVKTYISAGENAKVDALLKGFSVVRGNYGHALGHIMSHYGKIKTQNAQSMSYRANKAMLFQGRQIFHVDEALFLFRKYRDVESTWTLFQQVLDEFSNDKQEAEARVHRQEDEETEEDHPLRRPGKRYSQFNIGKVINKVLQTLVENGELDRALRAMEMLDAPGLQPTVFNYVVILSSMRDHSSEFQMHNRRNGKTNENFEYNATSYQMVLEDLRRRGMKVTKAVVGNLAPGYTNGDKQQRLQLLEAYDEVKDNAEDDYVLPTRCYGVLLEAMAKEGDVEDVKKLYEEAVSSLASQKNSRVPNEWVKTLIAKFGDEGLVVDAQKMLLLMPEMCGGFSYAAFTSVLHAAMAAGEVEVISSTLQVFEERSFRLNIRDAYNLVHLARDKQMGRESLEVLRLFEAANFTEAPPATDGQGNLEARFTRRNNNDAHALKKIKTMYNVALMTVEREGNWKQAMLLRERMVELMGEAAVDERSAHGSKKTRSHKSKQ